MITKEIRSHKIYIFKLLFGMYFLALFSQCFHHHSSDGIFKKTECKKKEITQNPLKEKPSVCLACHFLATGHTLVPDKFSLSFENYSYQVKEMIIIQERIWSQTKFSFQLRGPPIYC